MLLSTVIRLHASEPGRIDGSTGRAIHGFWFRHWERVEHNLADTLHHSQEVPPFTLSPLMGLPLPKSGVTEIAPGQPAWFRVATLVESLSEPTVQLWIPSLPPEIEIAGVTWELDNPVYRSPEDHPWAGGTSYLDLVSSKLNPLQPPQKWRLEFLTPVAFKAAKGHFPFPLPNSLVASWLRRWQAYSPVALPAELPERVREEVLVSSFELKTIPVRYGERLIVGCIGTLDLFAGDLHPAERAALDTLAAFAFYAGSGVKTTQGMGMTRLVQAFH